jgi:outer membrane protein assembly factor BamA
MRAIAALLLSMLVMGAAHADGVDEHDPSTWPIVMSIAIHGNKKTTDETVLRIAGIGVGDRFGPRRLDKVRSNLISSELFADVVVESTPVDGGVALTLKLKEKLSWIIAPTFYVQPGNLAGGGGFLESNLFGLNKKLLLYGQLGQLDTFLLGIYLDPAVHNTRWYFRLDTYLLHSRVTEYVGKSGYLDDPQPTRRSTMTYLDFGAMFGRNIRRGLGVDLRIRGAKVAFTDAQSFDPGHPPTTPPQDDGYDFSAEGRIIYDHRAYRYGTVGGTMVQLTIAHSIPGSSYSYHDNNMKFMTGFHLPWNHNLVIKGFGGLGYHLPFEQEYLTGGENDLRGYKNSEFRGDLDVEVESEYSVPLWRWRSLSFRGLGFWDTIYNTIPEELVDQSGPRHYLPGQVDEKISQWRNGVGVGFRIYFRSIVVPLLGIDVGWGIEGDEFHAYLAIGLTDL